MNNGNGSVRTEPSQFEWQAEFHARQEQIEVGRKLGLPSFVYLGGFVEYVLASRHFALHGVWPKGIKPICPSTRGLSAFQCNWIRYQRNTNKFNAWLAAMDERSRVKKIARREALVQEIAQTPHDQPLPIAISPLGQYVASRSQKGGRAA